MGGGNKKKRRPGRNANKQKKNNAPKEASTKNRLPKETNVAEEAVEMVENGYKERRWRVFGLANLRNTCYFNSVLQLLLSSTYLQGCFTHFDVQAIVSPSSLTAAMCDKKIQFKPTRALGVIRSAEPAFKASMSLRDSYEGGDMQSRGQHDAHELLTALLHHLVEEARNFKERETNWMDSTFGGKMMSTITCQSCGYVKSREEDFLVLSISVVKDDVPDAESSVSHALNVESVLPDVVERDDPEALTHLQPAADQSSLQNNFLDDSASEAAQNEVEGPDGDALFFALNDLFSNPDEEEDESPSVTSFYEKDSPETVNNEFCQTKGRRKGKKKGRKKADRFEELEFDIEECETVNDSRRFQSMEECLQHFFSHERVTWRCAGEFPEKRVSFSDEPEVFLLPSSSGSHSGILKSYLNECDLPKNPSDEEEEGETSEEATDESSVQQCSTGLKSCLKTKKREPLPPVPPLNSTKQYFVWRAPKVLCIHLKRFEALGHRRISKLSHAIEFATKMNLENFVDPKIPSDDLTEYELKAVVCHSGSLSFGHYTAFASRTANGEQEWYDVSDTSVKKVTLGEVLKSQAYILLYEAPETVSCAS